MPFGSSLGQRDDPGGFSVVTISISPFGIYGMEHMLFLEPLEFPDAMACLTGSKLRVA